MHIPLIREYWIGNTYIHNAGDGEAPAAARLELRAMLPEDIEEILRCPDPDLRGRKACPRAELTRYGAWAAGKLAGVCTFEWGHEYRGYYALKSGEAELVDIFTTAEVRGRGVAAALIGFGTTSMHRLGFRTLYAKIWHNNIASVKAFRKAGWTKRCFFIHLEPDEWNRAISVQWPPCRCSFQSRPRS
jgi:GNAT superfamily N-acetyltransferase